VPKKNLIHGEGTDQTLAFTDVNGNKFYIPSTVSGGQLKEVDQHWNEDPLVNFEAPSKKKKKIAKS
jgi:hypothetical protein